LEWIPNRGFLLRPLDPTELDSSYPVHVALEALATDLLPDNVDDPDWWSGERKLTPTAATRARRA
jgi:DNA-binding GntR family transcriptional regulator